MHRPHDPASRPRYFLRRNGLCTVRQMSLHRSRLDQPEVEQAAAAHRHALTACTRQREQTAPGLRCCPPSEAQN